MGAGQEAPLRVVTLTQETLQYGHTSCFHVKRCQMGRVLKLYETRPHRSVVSYSVVLRAVVSLSRFIILIVLRQTPCLRAMNNTQIQVLAKLFLMPVFLDTF